MVEAASADVAERVANDLVAVVRKAMAGAGETPDSA
jgi:hypothetical protein